MSAASRENAQTLVAVSAYAGDLSQVQNNLPLYLHHETQVVILSPKDAPITQFDIGHPGVVTMQAGEKGWIGAHTLERQRLFLECLLKFPQQYFLFHDSDSICLSPRIPKYLYDRPHILWSNEVTDTNTAPSLLPKLALQPPYFFSRRVAEALLEAAKHPATSYYQGAAPTPENPALAVPTGCIDHVMLQWVYATEPRIEHKSFFTGCSFETGTEHGAHAMQMQVQNGGKVLIHSVKTKPVLQRLVAAHKEFLRTH